MCARNTLWQLQRILKASGAIDTETFSLDTETFSLRSLLILIELTIEAFCAALLFYFTYVPT
jgi:hypothetical protein